MSQDQKNKIKLLSTGIGGLDEVLGGGLPEYSFNLVAGPPGAGKTTLVQQITFANATDERRAVYFTVVGEPPLKMLRYQQQMGFFDPEKVGGAIQFVDLSQEALAGDLDSVFKTIVEQVRAMSPAIVVIDSFRTLVQTGVADLTVRTFLQRLCLQLITWQVTSFLVGEYGASEMEHNPVFTVADGILWLDQAKERNSIVRKLEVTKMRGVAAIPGLHTFRVGASGIQVFPRTTSRMPTLEKTQREKTRVVTGVPGLDKMLGGGIPAGDATLVCGPSGTGKTILGTQFLVEGTKEMEPGVLAIFEEHPHDYLSRAKEMGFDLDTLVENGKLRLIYLRPLDLSADEILHRIQEAVTELDAKRLVIDSLNGLELALAPAFRQDFRESLYRLIGRLTGEGVSVVLTIEVMESFTEVQFSPHAVSFLAQNILFMRYIEIEGRLRKMLAVIKMRRSGHSHDLYEYEITRRGLHVMEPLAEYAAVLSGMPKRRERPERSSTPGLTDAERRVLDTLVALQEGTEVELSNATQLTSAMLTRALDRLTALNYAIRVADEGRTVYRPVELPLRR